MKHFLSLLLLFLAAATFAACGGKSASDAHHDGDGHDHGTEADHDGDEHEAGDHDGHDHDGHDHDGHDHDGHDHGEDAHHGPRHDLGEVEVAGLSLKVAVLGAVEAGREAVLDIEVTGGPCAALRAWIGIASGRGSMKARLDGTNGDFHGHIEVPSTLPTGSAIWLDVEGPGGTRERMSVALPQ